MPGVNQAAGGCNCSTGVTCVTCFGTIPDTLSVTDANGTYTATWNSTLSLWITPHLCAVNQTNASKCISGVTTCDNVTHPSGQPIYAYGIGCISAGHMAIYRYWYELRCVSPAYQYILCGCSSNAGSQAYSSSGSVAVTCGSIAWSGTLTKIVGNLSDPVGGTTSFTQ